MASAIVTLKSANPFIQGKSWIMNVEFTGPSSSTEGGEPLSLKEAGFGKEAVFGKSITCWVKQLSEQATYRPDLAFYDGEKVHFIDTATGKELAKEKDLSKVKVLFEIHCGSN